MEAVDILLDANDDYLSAEGDFAVGSSDGQHIRHIVLAAPGDYRFAPLVGVATLQEINSAGGLKAWAKEVRLQLQADGYQSITVDTTDPTAPIVDATR